MPTKILALLPEPSTARRCLDIALAAAAVVEDAEVEAFHVRVAPESLIAAPEEIDIQLIRTRYEGTAEFRAEQVHAAFRAWLDALPDAARARVSWRDTAGAEEASVVAEARHADLLVLARPHNMDGGDAQHAAIRSSHRPVLYVPDACAAAPHFAERIAIAWKPTPQAHHAVEGAAVWLRRAQQVIALMVAPDLEAGGWEELERLGRQLAISMTPHLIPPEDGKIGRQLTEAIHALGVDVTVLGAYRFPDLIEWALPSTTRYILSHADIPLFLAH